MDYRKVYGKLLEQCTGECCKKGEYCFLKELLIVTHKYDHRTIFQIKLVEIYKFNESKKADVDIGWEEALKRWVENGYAAKFAEFYNPIEDPEQVKLSPVEVYRQIMKEN